MEFKNDNVVKTNLNNLNKERRKINRGNNKKNLQVGKQFLLDCIFVIISNIFEMIN